MKKVKLVSTRCYEQGGNAYVQIAVDGAAVRELSIHEYMDIQSPDYIFDMLESMGFDYDDETEIVFCPFAQTYYERYEA